jgi:DNA polymerase-1
MDAIMGQFKRLNQWCKEQLRSVRLDGYVWTWWDGRRARRRPLYRVADQGDDKSGGRVTAENGSINTPVQGTASDFCLRSLAECVRWIEEDGLEEEVKLVLTVHDSLLFEADAVLEQEVIGTVREIMTGWNSAGVPLVVDAKSGPSWGSLKKVD